MRWTLLWVMAVAGCDSAAPSSEDGGTPSMDAGRTEDASGADASGLDAGPDASLSDGGSDDASPESDASTPADCDYREVDGIVVIEAETMSFSDPWIVGEDPDASEGRFIEWTSASNNNRTSEGRFEAAIRIDTPGLYRLQVRNRVGMGTNATEHNDTWMQFPDAAAFYGVRGPSDMQHRVYPRPLCEDTAFLDTIASLPDVAEATCPAGTSREGYFKVYSSGALDWRWSARTSDNDAHDLFVRFDDPGVYAYQLAARGDFHQLDRIVIHLATLANAEVQDLALSETTCP